MSLTRSRNKKRGKLIIKNRNAIWNIIILIPFFKPFGLTGYFPFSNLLFQSWKIASLFAIAFILFWTNKYKIIIRHKAYYGLALCWLIYIINDCIRNVSPIDVINNCLTSIFLLEFIDVNAGSRRQNDLLISFYYIFLLDIILQASSMLLIWITKTPIFNDPTEGDFTYLFGTDNYSAFTMLPMIAVVLFIHEFLNLKSKTTYCIISISILCYGMTGSLTAFISGGIMLLLFIIIKKGIKLPRFLNPKFVLFIAFLVFLLIVFCNIQNAFSSLLVNYLKKGLTLNSRTIIWDNAIQIIKKYPVFGTGDLSESQILAYALYGNTHAQNFFLDILLRVGFIGLISYLVFIFGFITKNNKILRSFPGNIISVSFLSLIILFMMDFYFNIPAFYSFIGIAYSLRNFYQYQYRNNM